MIQSSSNTRLGLKISSVRLILCVILLSLKLTGRLTAQSTDDDAKVDIHDVEVIVVVGAGGTLEFEESFHQWADQWTHAAGLANANVTRVGPPNSNSELSDRQLLENATSQLKGAIESPAWIVLIGHGTYSQDAAKFNLRGPDIAAEELARWLQPITRPLVVVNCSSSSAPFVNHLSAANRIVVTATRSGTEQNYSRFGKYFADAISSSTSDLDHDDEVSVLEAFLKASSDVQMLYESESRIATEHALLDDNGDGKGTAATLFRGTRAIGATKNNTPLDGKEAARMILVPAKDRVSLTAEELKQRNDVEDQLDALRLQRATLSDLDYERELESLMLRQAMIYESAEKRHASTEH